MHLPDTFIVFGIVEVVHWSSQAVGAWHGGEGVTPLWNVFEV